MREFIFGSNTTGLVSGDSVVGGEDAALAADAIRGQDGIYLGSISTTSTLFYPSATIAAWNSFIVTATATATATTSTNGAVRGASVPGVLGVVLTVAISVVFGSLFCCF